MRCGGRFHACCSFRTRFRAPSRPGHVPSGFLSFSPRMMSLRPRHAVAIRSAPPLFDGRPIQLMLRSRPARTSLGPSTQTTGSGRSRQSAGKVSPRLPSWLRTAWPAPSRNGNRRLRPANSPSAFRSGKVQQPGRPASRGGSSSRSHASRSTHQPMSNTSIAAEGSSSSRASASFCSIPNAATQCACSSMSSREDDATASSWTGLSPGPHWPQIGGGADSAAAGMRPFPSVGRAVSTMAMYLPIRPSFVSPLNSKPEIGSPRVRAQRCNRSTLPHQSGFPQIWQGLAAVTRSIAFRVELEPGPVVPAAVRGAGGPGLLTMVGAGSESRGGRGSAPFAGVGRDASPGETACAAGGGGVQLAIVEHPIRGRVRARRLLTRCCPGRSDSPGRPGQLHLSCFSSFRSAFRVL